MSALANARRLLRRPDAWLEAVGPDYALRVAPTRKGRVMLTLTEADFRALVQTPGLRARRSGGWVAVAPATDDSLDHAGRPGVIEGQRTLMLADGTTATRRANLAQSPITWLASRYNAQGQPWLTPAQIAAAERLGRDAEIALRGPSVTMRWDALPRAGGGSSARVEPGDAALAAARRVEAALAACGAARAMIDHICLRATALQAAEHGLGLKRRAGKTLLIQGLAALAKHYRIG